MKKALKTLLWRSLFWLTWPLIAFYSPLRTRSRILVVCGTEFLVVKPYFGSGLWQLPGGGIKFGETALHAAVRELHEEAGIRVDPSQVRPLMPLRTYHENGLLKRYAVFTVSITSKKQEKIKDYEIVDLTWLPLQGPHPDTAVHVTYAVSNYTSTPQATR